MAIFKTPAELRKFELSNGTTADLIALIGVGKPEGWVAPATAPAIGTVAYVEAMGSMRRGVVVKTTKTKVHVAVTTQGAVDAALRTGFSNQPVRVQICIADINYVRVAPDPEIELAHAEALREQAVREVLQAAREVLLLAHAEAIREDWARGRVAAAGESWDTHLVKFGGAVLPREVVRTFDPEAGASAPDGNRHASQTLGISSLGLTPHSQDGKVTSVNNEAGTLIEQNAAENEALVLADAEAARAENEAPGGIYGPEAEADEQRWTLYGSIIDAEAAAYAEDAERTGPTFQEDYPDTDPEAAPEQEWPGGLNPAEHNVLSVREPRKATGSAVVKLLERVHERIRQNHPDVPPVVIVTGAGTGPGSNKWGHFRPNGWTSTDDASPIHEMFMAGETLAKGARQVLQTMLHESAHALAQVRGKQDTSRQNRWHNKVFLEMAQEMGLEHRSDNADKAHGYSFVTLTEDTLAEYSDLLAKLDREIHLMVKLPVWLGGDAGENGGEGMGKKPTEGGESKSTSLKLTCLCDEPNIVRASKKVAEKLVVRCEDCDELFKERD